MKHAVSGRKFGLKRNKRKALLKSLVHALIENKRIKTTLERAKETKKITERLISKAKINSLSVIRKIRELLDKNDTSKLLSLAKEYTDRTGGYLRIIKTLPRLKDNAKMAIIEFIETKKDTTKNEKKQ